MTFSEHVCDGLKGGSKASKDGAGAGGSDVNDSGKRCSDDSSKRSSDRSCMRTCKNGLHEDREGVLKVGQSVVLMDSSLRGKIVSIGRTVRIELEDGLVIDAAYGEFAITDSAEIASLKGTKVKTKKTSATSKQNKPAVRSDGSLVVDLHIEALLGGTSIPKGQQLQFQMDTFRRVIRENIIHRGRKIAFIHGLGDGILKSAIRKELDEVLPLHCTYTVGDPAVTVVTIR